MIPPQPPQANAARQVQAFGFDEPKPRRVMQFRRTATTLFVVAAIAIWIAFPFFF